MLFEKLAQVNEEINEQYQKEKKGYCIALVGNPNVGKSTVFNAFTGMKQHTGNWPGKTVALARGYFIHKNRKNEMIDLPGAYSLLAHSSEEEVTRDFICFAQCDMCMVVCDSTCLERNLNLVLQTLEITSNVILALNLMDEAKKKGIAVAADKLNDRLGIPVIEMSARNQQGFDEVKRVIEKVGEEGNKRDKKAIVYKEEIEEAIERIGQGMQCKKLPPRFLALKLLDPVVDSTPFYKYISNLDDVISQCTTEIAILKEKGLYDQYEEYIVQALNKRAEEISDACIVFHNASYQQSDLSIDRFVTSKGWGLIGMIAMLSVIFWITISAANVPSQLLSSIFETLEDWMHTVFLSWQVSEGVRGFIVDGVMKTCGWVIAVMLPPMMIFFPLFTLLEDFGYLPRVAFNLDGFFQKACTCGKQALTMCMGFGCNAVGVSGARIIDSPRERLIAIITNVFVPCNGRFPTFISIITMFFAGVVAPPFHGIFSTLLLTGVILFGIFLTFFISRILSKTVLKGVPSAFTLELPPYRRPQIRKVIIRSIFDRTLFVLGRAISVAIPAGAIIWCLANIQYGDVSCLQYISDVLDPFAQLMGLDGVILLAFLLGFPANEIVVPIMIMAYMATGSMQDMSDLHVLKELFVQNGWTWITAVCTLLFSLAHFPCATTLLTIKKETGSWKWTWISFFIPSVCGVVLCMLVNALLQLFV